MNVNVITYGSVVAVNGKHYVLVPSSLTGCANTCLACAFSKDCGELYKLCSDGFFIEEGTIGECSKASE